MLSEKPLVGRSQVLNIRLPMRRLVILYVEKCPVQTLNNIKKPDENIIKLICAQYD